MGEGREERVAPNLGNAGRLDPLQPRHDAEVGDGRTGCPGEPAGAAVLEHLVEEAEVARQDIGVYGLPNRGGVGSVGTAQHPVKAEARLVCGTRVRAAGD